METFSNFLAFANSPQELFHSIIHVSKFDDNFHWQTEQKLLQDTEGRETEVPVQLPADKYFQ